MGGCTHHPIPIPIHKDYIHIPSAPTINSRPLCLFSRLVTQRSPYSPRDRPPPSPGAPFGTQGRALCFWPESCRIKENHCKSYVNKSPTRTASVQPPITTAGRVEYRPEVVAMPEATKLTCEVSPHILLRRLLSANHGYDVFSASNFIPRVTEHWFIWRRCIVFLVIISNVRSMR